MLTLTVITPIIRPDMAIEAARSVQVAQQRAADVVDLRHVMAYWPGPPDPSRVRVAAWLNRLRVQCSALDGWVMFIDDDTRMHPDLPRRLVQLVAEHDRDEGALHTFVFDMLYPEMGGVLRAALPPALGAIDGGQVVMRTYPSSGVPWEIGEYGDGKTLQRLYSLYPAGWVVVPEALTAHNHQRWAGPDDWP